jgi:hypothetical protein
MHNLILSELKTISLFYALKTGQFISNFLHRIAQGAKPGGQVSKLLLEPNKIICCISGMLELFCCYNSPHRIEIARSQRVVQVCEVLHSMCV